MKFATVTVNVQHVGDARLRREWSGSLREFFRANQMDAETRAFACSVLRAGAAFEVGGGAAVRFVVEVAS